VMVVDDDEVNDNEVVNDDNELFILCIFSI